MATNAVVACTLLKVNITKAVLTYNGITADVALPDDATDWSTQLASLFSNTTTSVGTTSWFAYVSYQVNDPRQNLNNLDWPQGTVSAVGAAYNGTADAVNTGVTMTTSGKDLEDGKVIAADTPLNDPSYKFTATAGPRLSTAYIRNGPMVSPWELGCIHRGALWETINLGEYNKAAAINPLTGGGNYTDTTGGADPNAVNGGDANILDQVKMTARVQSDQKVSLKLQTDTGGGFGILNALFKKIHVGASYANGVRLYNTSATVAALPSTGNVTGDARIVIADLNLYTWNGVSWASGTKKVSDAYIYNTSNGVTYWDGATWQIWSANGSDLTNSATMVNDIKTKSLTFLTRANVVQSATLKNGTGGTQTSKRAKEEIIGKMINLTSIAQADYFTVIVLAQSIKDVGPGIFYKDLDMDGICTPTSTANEATLGADIDGDGVITNPTAIPEQINSTAAGFGKYTQYADEIIAEQKIRADVYRDPLTRKCTIIKMEYVEE